MGKTKLYCDFEENGKNGVSDTNGCRRGKSGKSGF